ncbi:integrase [Sporosarcina sp. NCCP-2716]|uniref:tyrosine-type recombinase/integrase n=1 Tax=Sporosarcina sp. NCCP-2716 TaxID=2943679 RepID=UPI00203A49C5|nr:tyrosine-type recombinase/integrase [Sporosarcina sp. NCCP-2716]GKV69815.1 integrase [Sporosarcina sp. NCCP-2716]
MASFTKRGKTWQYTVSNKGKPIRKGGFATKKEAQVAAAEVEMNLQRGIIPTLREVAFADYFKKWIDLYKMNISGQTMYHYSRSLKVVEDYFGDTPLQRITRHDYQAFINAYGSTRSKETVDKLNYHCRACVRDAVEDMIIPFDFTRKVHLTYTVKAKRSEDKHLGYNDSKALFQELVVRLDTGLGYYLLLLGLSTGLRFGELVGLTRKDFDFEECTINIDKTWGYSKNSPEGFGPTKNEESIRVLKVNQFTMDCFKKLFKRLPTNIHQLVFFSQASKYKVISNANANKLLGKTLTDLGIKKVNMHGLRHTHASVLLYQKVSMNYVSERLGHKDVETTWKTYSHILEEMREQDEQATVSIFESMAV